MPMTVAEDAIRGHVAAAGGDPPARSAASSRLVSRTLVGRAAELDLLTDTVVASPAVAVVEGEAGIGKTRLITELAARPELSRRRFVMGECGRVREPFPLGPVIEALRGLEDELRGARLSPVVGALRPLLPELAPLLPPVPEPLDDRAAERHRVFRGIVGLLRALGPAVLVLDDLHWADEHTAEFLTYLLGTMPAELSVVLAYRSEESMPRVRAVTAKLPTSVRHADVHLGPLDTDQTEALAASILDTVRVSREFAAHLWERSAGVPFAIEELLAVLQARGTLARHGGRWERKALDELDVPAGIADPVLERVGNLSDAGRAIVEAAAVLHEPVPLDVLIAVARVSRSRATRGVEEALSSGLLVERDERIAWRHVLAAQAVYEALLRLRKTDLHARSAAALEGLDPVPLGLVAHHLRHAGRLRAWVQAAERAADRAIELGHDDEAVRYLEDLLRHAPLEAEHRARLAVKLGRAWNETLRPVQEVSGLLAEAMQQDLPRTIRGELTFWLALVTESEGADPAGQRQLFEQAARDLDDRPDLKAWALLGLGFPSGAGIPLAEHKKWLLQTLETLPEIDDPRFAAFVLGKVAMVLVSVGDRGWRQVADQLEHQTGGRPHGRREVSAYHSVGAAAGYMAHYRTAERLLTAALGEAQSCESRLLQLRAEAALALLDFSRGSWDGLDDKVGVLLEELSDYLMALIEVEVAAGCLALARGQVETARQRLTGIAHTLETHGDCDLLPFAIAALARLAIATGDIDDAVARTGRLLTLLDSKNMWASVTRALPAITQLLLADGQQRRASELLAHVAPELEHLDAPLGPAAVRHAQGFLAAAERDLAVAGDRFLAAADLYEGLGCPYEAAQAREQAAGVLLETGDAHAEQTVRAALTTYQRLGARWDTSRCTQLARSHGLHIAVPHRGGREGYGQQLSPREIEVVRLVATGATNPEIGQALFLSRKTVARHLSAAMRKLGVHSRTAVAMAAAQQGLLADDRPGSTDKG